MVIWITGISAAGKTTLCTALYDIIKPQFPETVFIDSETIREMFGKGLSYREEDRRRQVERVQRLAKMLDDQGLIVIVAILYSHPELLQWNREMFEGYFEIYLDAPLELVQSRDPKQIYAKAEKGEMPHVVGLDVPWHAPEHPNLVVDSLREERPGDVAKRIISAIPKLKSGMS